MQVNWPDLPVSHLGQAGLSVQRADLEVLALLLAECVIWGRLLDPQSLNAFI